MTNYYVDSNISVSGDGLTPETAKKTIAEGIALITSDSNTLNFIGGSSWNEHFNMAPYDNITYQAYGAGDLPKIKRTLVLTPASWSGPDGNGCYTYTTAVCKWLIEDDHALEQGSGVTLPEGNGTWFYSGGIIYYKATDGSNPGTNGKTVEVVIDYSIAQPLSSTAISGTVLDGLHVKFSPLYLDAYGPVVLTPMTIQNCRFTETNDVAIPIWNRGLDQDGFIIQDNIFEACAAQVYLIAEGSGRYLNARIRRNTITKSNLLNDGVTPWGVGLDTDGLSYQSVYNSIVEQNDISGCPSSSAAISGFVPGNIDCTGNIIRRNYCHNLGGHGISWAGEYTPNTNCQIYDNIVTHFGTRGIEVNKAQTSTTKSGIYNNTITDGPTGIRIGTQADYFILRNNIVYDCTYAVDLEGTWGANMVADHNLYNPAGGNNFVISGVEKTLAQYQTYISPDDSDVKTADPLFVNAGGSFALDTDFKLQSDSPCINAGVDVGLTTDYGGESIVGVPDIGAWEFGGGFRKIYIGGLQCNLTVI